MQPSQSPTAAVNRAALDYYLPAARDQAVAVSELSIAGFELSFQSWDFQSRANAEVGEALDRQDDLYQGKISKAQHDAVDIMRKVVRAVGESLISPQQVSLKAIKGEIESKRLVAATFAEAAVEATLAKAPPIAGLKQALSSILMDEMLERA